ncbi:amino acid ABC transporter [Pseudodesulfovibrio portus]|uniref:Amino acid ABC transporter n=1 Tax=Pseudodesulfovibrio portus TaxID=231439 RepID=A0ABN6RPM5_9BACT|nr:amino acid ABC transporter [Pseudodesulfovibrio portus]
MVFAVATGFPPYQFETDEGAPTGLDVDVVKLVCARLGVEVNIVQGPWEDMLTMLRTGKVDCVAGMEMTEKRGRIFDFTNPYYTRRSIVFTLVDNWDINSLDDLRGRIIAGDRHSAADERLSRLYPEQRIRILYTESKDKSFRMLRSGEVVALIAPMAVGYHLGFRYRMALKVIDDVDPGVSVALAVNKGELRLRDRLNAAIVELMQDGSMATALRKWKVQ